MIEIGNRLSRRSENVQLIACKSENAPSRERWSCIKIFQEGKEFLSQHKKSDALNIKSVPKWEKNGLKFYTYHGKKANDRSALTMRKNVSFFL